MLRVLSIVSLFWLLIPCAASSSTGNGSELNTTIVEGPTYDGSSGKTEIAVKDLRTSKMQKLEWEGLWHDLGYNPRTGQYVLAGEFQVGAWEMLTEIRYLNEKDLKQVPSRYYWHA